MPAAEDVALGDAVAVAVAEVVQVSEPNMPEVRLFLIIWVAAPLTVLIHCLPCTVCMTLEDDANAFVTATAMELWTPEATSFACESCKSEVPVTTPMTS
mmetsp:Transcript_106106/g.342563  ORF Transcript_106106/g.342563 Transcript_106106/m.342563 type:complete len:99 (-) Transcript_106106:227-523(-)